jgi:hypothetical protein
MRISLAKHGGLAAGMLLGRPPQVLDSDSLSPDAAAELERLVAAAMAAPVVESGRPGQARDAMSYTITIEDGGKQTVLRQSDTSMSPAFASLRAWLERHLKGQ